VDEQDREIPPRISLPAGHIDILADAPPFLDEAKTGPVVEDLLNLVGPHTMLERQFVHNGIKPDDGLDYHLG
jgi:hypothetical protein